MSPGVDSLSGVVSVQLEWSLGVYSQSGVLEWIVRVEYWCGQLEWSLEVEYWCGYLEWSLGADSQSGVLVWIVRVESWCGQLEWSLGGKLLMIIVSPHCLNTVLKSIYVDSLVTLLMKNI